MTTGCPAASGCPPDHDLAVVLKRLRRGLGRSAELRAGLTLINGHVDDDLAGIAARATVSTDSTVAPAAPVSVGLIFGSDTKAVPTT